MKTSIQTVLLVAALVLSATAQEQKESPAQPLSTGAATLASITATVQAVDHGKREVTLKRPLGKMITFVVDKRVQRLNEVKVGDQVRADYYVSLAGELRQPTAEEEQTPLVVLGALARAPAGSEPAAGGLHQIKAVTTVEGLDLPTPTVTLKSPRGNYVTIRAQDAENLKQLSLEDTIIVTYTEALAISLEKVPSGDKTQTAQK